MEELAGDYGKSFSSLQTDYCVFMPRFIWYYELFIVPLKLNFNTREMKNT